MLSWGGWTPQDPALQACQHGLGRCPDFVTTPYLAFKGAEPNLNPGVTPAYSVEPRETYILLIQNVYYWKVHVVLPKKLQSNSNNSGRRLPGPAT